MKKSIKIISILLLFFIAVGNLSADNQEKQRQWLNNLRDFKHDFLIKEMSLSKTQQTEFFPLYSMMESEIYQINKEARDLVSSLSKMNSISEVEYEKAAESISQVKSKEAQVETEYYKKFQQFLSSKQLFLLQRAEMRFTKNMLNHHRMNSKK